MKNRKIILILSFLVLHVIPETGYAQTNNGPSDIDTLNAVKGDMIIVRIMAEPDALNPILTSDVTADQINVYIFESLNTVDPVTYELKPLLASLPEISSDNLSYTYRLERNAKFSDGKPLTGEDVIFTMKAMKNPFVHDEALRKYYEDLESVELVNGDSYTVKFKMTKPFWRAIYSIGDFFILPKHKFDPSGLTENYTWSDLDANTSNAFVKRFADVFNNLEFSDDPSVLVGSGPYKLDNWDVGFSITLSRNENYWNKANVPAYLNKIQFKVIQDNSAALVAAKNKEIDLMYVVFPSDFYKNLENSERFDLVKATPSEPVFTYIGWNYKNPLFADRNVRWALSYLINRDAIIDKVSYGNAVKIQSPVFYKHKFYNTDLPEIRFDPERAKQLLADAGWKDSDNDGILDKQSDGKKIDFRFTFMNNNNPARRQALLIMIDEFKKAGIQADIQDFEWSIYLDKTRKHEFDATLTAWALSIIPFDPYQIFHSSQADEMGSNYVSYSDPESDRLIEEYRTEFDESKRIEIIKKWQQVIYDDQVYTFLWSSKARYIYNSRFRNCMFYDKRNSYNLNEWWVPKEKHRYKF